MQAFPVVENLDVIKDIGARRRRLSSGGQLFLEDNPGLAKTLIAASFFRALGLNLKRIQ